jgi:membrane associated rhomboid family serine protease
MGLYDRDYTQADFRSQYRHAPQMRMTLPQVTPFVKWLLIANIVVYFMQVMGGDNLLTSWFSVHPASFIKTLQLWRLVTYQFLHGDLLHILFNMLGLFFLGPTLERHWGSKKFLVFYLGCGMVGGFLYPLLVWVKIIGPHPVAGILPLIGASGAILGMLAACAILFPQFVVLILFFPVPIRVAAIILLFMATAVLLGKGSNAGGEAAHLGGMAAGAAYVFSQSWRNKFTSKLRTGQWEKQIASRHNLQAELDRILQKVHDSGIQSLTHKEKKTLKEATKAEQMRNKF